MSEQPSKAPYLWAALSVVAIVAAAWFNQSRVPAVIPGNPSPAFTVLNADGEPVSSEEWEGKVILVNIWATWCAPCREEMPSMQRLYEQFDPSDFEILAISVDAEMGDRDTRGYPGGDPVAFAESLSLTFPILRDSSQDIERIFQTTGVPESFLIGRDGVIYKRVAGAAPWNAASNVAQVQRLVDGQ